MNQLDMFPLECLYKNIYIIPHPNKWNTINYSELQNNIMLFTNFINTQIIIYPSNKCKLV